MLLQAQVVAPYIRRQQKCTATGAVLDDSYRAEEEVAGDCGDKVKVKWLQRWVGHSGAHPEQYHVLLYGWQKLFVLDIERHIYYPEICET